MSENKLGSSCHNDYGCGEAGVLQCVHINKQDMTFQKCSGSKSKCGIGGDPKGVCYPILKFSPLSKAAKIKKKAKKKFKKKFKPSVVIPIVVGSLVAIFCTYKMKKWIDNKRND